jgi:hypothetical protein
LVNNLALSADLSANLGEFAAAERALAAAHEWMEDLPDQGKAELDLAFEEAYLNRCRGDWDVAIPRLQALYEKGRQETGYAQVVSRNASLALFDIWLEQNQLDKAEEVALGGVAIDKLHLTLYSVHALSRLCSVRAFQGRAEEALELLQRVRAKINADSSVPERINFYLCEARVAIGERDWTKAFERYAQVLQLLAQSSMLWRQARILTEWANLQLERNETGDQLRARQLFSEALAIFQTINAYGYVSHVQSKLNGLA